MLGASIAVTRGVYPAELQAIARTLAMFPSSCSLHLHTDSQGALAGIHAFERECNERKRLRMAARPLLLLIHHLRATRTRAGGSVTFEHIKAHTLNTDVHSVGNRLLDHQANLARQRPDRPRPLALEQLPLDKCEHRMAHGRSRAQAPCSSTTRDAPLWCSSKRRHCSRGTRLHRLHRPAGAEPPRPPSRLFHPAVHLRSRRT